MTPMLKSQKPFVCKVQFSKNAQIEATLNVEYPVLPRTGNLIYYSSPELPGQWWEVRRVWIYPSGHSDIDCVLQVEHTDYFE